MASFFLQHQIDLGDPQLQPGKKYLMNKQNWSKIRSETAEIDPEIDFTKFFQSHNQTS